MAYLRAFGPLFDGRAFVEMGRLDLGVRHAVGREAKNRWVGHLVLNIRQPTPYYWTTIAVNDRGPATVVHDDPSLPYGPWLEGVGSRNFPVTSFRGYWSMRDTIRSVPGWFDSVTGPVVAESVHRMGG